MRMTDTQLLILNAAGDSKAGVTLAHIATKVTVANPKRACEGLVKRGLMAAAEIKLTNGIGNAAGYALTKAGEESLGYPDPSDEPAGDHRPDGIEHVEIAKAEPEAPPSAKEAKDLKRQIEAGELRGSEKRLALIADAGVMPPPPNFSAETHRGFRARLAKVVEAATARDSKALAVLQPSRTNCSSTIPLDRYRRMALRAIQNGA